MVLKVLPYYFYFDRIVIFDLLYKLGLRENYLNFNINGSVILVLTCKGTDFRLVKFYEFLKKNFGFVGVKVEKIKVQKKGGEKYKICVYISGKGVFVLLNFLITKIFPFLIKKDLVFRSFLSKNVWQFMFKDFGEVNLKDLKHDFFGWENFIIFNFKLVDFPISLFLSSFKIYFK